LRGYEVGQPDNDEYDFGYTGINAAFVLDLLAADEEAVAAQSGVRSETAEGRRAQARRIRETLMTALPRRAERADGAWLRQSWWFLVTIGEAAFGLGDYERAGFWLGQAAALTDVSDWEVEATARQLAQLAELRSKNDMADPEAWTVLSTFLKGRAEAVRSARVGKVGLALSGGGFRAALFHIGVLARLAETDLLRHVEVLSCVSGGSIVGAHYYLELANLLRKKRDDEITREHYIELVQRVQEKFLEGVQTNIRTSVLAEPLTNLRMMFDARYTRTKRVGELFEERLYSLVDDGFTTHRTRRTMRDLIVVPKGESPAFSPKLHNWGRLAKVPMLVINATTLNTGHNWQFTASWMGEPPGSIDTAVDMGDRLRRMYYDEAPRNYRAMPLGDAVAASACVPGLFEPLVMDRLYPDRVVRLVDGGVSDNQGVAALVEQDCTLLLVSDASGQLASAMNPTSSRLSVLWRSFLSSQERVRVTQYQDVSARRRLGRIRGLAFMHLKKDLESNPVDWLGSQDPFTVIDEARSADLRRAYTRYGIPKDVQVLLSEMRTDLDSFTDAEAYALMTCGYRMTALELRERVEGFPNLDAPSGAWRFLQIEPQLQSGDVTVLKEALAAGRAVQFKAWSLLPWLRALTWTLLAAMILALLWISLPATLDAYLPQWVRRAPTSVMPALRTALVLLIGLIISRLPLATLRSWMSRSAAAIVGAVASFGFKLYLAFIERPFQRTGSLQALASPSSDSAGSRAART
jgi:predicted acylesterase/phospholipase RssA